MYISSYSDDRKKVIKLLCETFGLTCESTIRGNHDFKTCKSLHVGLSVLHDCICVRRVNIPTYECAEARVKCTVHDCTYFEPTQYVHDDGIRFQRKLTCKTYNAQVKAITRLCYNKLAEMLVGHAIKINNSNVDIPDADSFEELKLKLMVSR